MQKLKDFLRWLNTHDGYLFTGGFAASNFFHDLARGWYGWAIASLLLTAWFLHRAHEEVGE